VARNAAEVEHIDEERRKRVFRFDGPASAVQVALPVVVSTNHGIAICATVFPASEIASAPYSA
jgi:hypothetical protein